MKKRIGILLFVCISAIGLLLLFNTEVTYQQGINHQVHTVRIPLYLKTLDFYDRHYNYKNLVRKIISDSDSKAERVMKIFNWTYANIREVPEELPVVDDHVWHIIIRGYGTSDQYCDVFSTLCNYAGVDAFFDFIYTQDRSKVMPLAFVKLGASWSVFDAYNGVYFKNKAGEFASIEEMQKGYAMLYSISATNRQVTDYISYVEGLASFEDIGFKRANVQSPLRRFIYEVITIATRINKPDKNNEKD